MYTAWHRSQLPPHLPVTATRPRGTSTCSSRSPTDLKPRSRMAEMHDGMVQNRPRCAPADDSSLQKVFCTAFALQTDSFFSGMVGVRLYLEDTCESGSLMKAASDHLFVTHSARHKGYDFPLPNIPPPLLAAVQIHHRSLTDCLAHQVLWFTSASLCRQQCVLKAARPSCATEHVLLPMGRWKL